MNGGGEDRRRKDRNGRSVCFKPRDSESQGGSCIIIIVMIAILFIKYSKKAESQTDEAEETPPTHTIAEFEEKVRASKTWSKKQEVRLIVKFHPRAYIDKSIICD